jgi:hypothetical protein
MKRHILAAALALAGMLSFSEVASARWYYYGYPGYAVSSGGPYRAVPGPVPYSTILTPDSPTTLVVGPRGHVHYARQIVTTPAYVW